MGANQHRKWAQIKHFLFDLLAIIEYYGIFPHLRGSLCSGWALHGSAHNRTDIIRYIMYQVPSNPIQSKRIYRCEQIFKTLGNSMLCS